MSGACKDGYGVAIGPHSHNASPHFLVAVQLGRWEWGVRLLPQREDGTVGCAAHFNWELRNDRLYSQALRDRHIRTSSADTIASDNMTMDPVEGGDNLGAAGEGLPSGATEDVDDEDSAPDVLPLTMQVNRLPIYQAPACFTDLLTILAGAARRRCPQ